MAVTKQLMCPHCPDGHSLVRTMPQIVRAIRGTAGTLVDLGR